MRYINKQYILNATNCAKCIRGYVDMCYLLQIWAIDYNDDDIQVVFAAVNDLELCRSAALWIIIFDIA